MDLISPWGSAKVGCQAEEVRVIVGNDFYVVSQEGIHGTPGRAGLGLAGFSGLRGHSSHLVPGLVVVWGGESGPECESLGERWLVCL